MKVNNEKLKKVKSLYNNTDYYYTSESFPTKYIDGTWFVGVKRDINDKRYFFMNKESLVNVDE